MPIETTTHELLSSDKDDVDKAGVGIDLDLADGGAAVGEDRIVMLLIPFMLALHQLAQASDVFVTGQQVGCSQAGTFTRRHSS